MFFSICQWSFGDIVPFCKKSMKGYYHVSSHGLERNDIFKTKADFIAGINDVAIRVLGFDVRILCFCLMSNHFHFLLYGTPAECRRFANEYKRKCAMRMRLISGEVCGLKDVEIQIDLVDSQEYLENVIAYILRNPVASGMILMPYHYPWSSAAVYFSGGALQKGTMLGEMGVRQRYRVLKSRVSLPDSYVVDDDGMIIPSCYVDVEAVEKIFRHPSRLLMLLAKRVENDVEIRLGMADRVTMTDQEILTQMQELIRMEFNKESIVQLSMNQRLKLCVLLKRNFGSGIKQIARLTRLEPEVVAKVI